LVLVGCGDDNNGPTATPSSSSRSSGAVSQSLTDTSWILVSYQANQANSGNQVSLPALPGATLAFAAGDKLSGSTGCNSFGGTYTVNGTSLKITVDAMTQRGCDAVMTEQETAVTKLLPTVASYAISDNMLKLSGSDGKELMRYVVTKKALSGTSWQVTGVNNGKGAVESTSLTENLTAQFGADNTFSGSGGCNQLSGPYTSNATTTLTIGPLSATEKSCADDVNQLEAAYTAALGAVAAYEISGDTLTMRDTSGATQVTAMRGS
jgi:heat shock protein HslJ